MLSDGDLVRGLSQTLHTTHFDAAGDRYEGKVRDCYSRGGKRLIVATDRVSAFDRVLGTIPFKGQVLNQLAHWWFLQTENIAPNHALRLVDPCVMECIECKPFAAEFVVRAYATGTTSTSLWTHYESGARVFCGHALPDGLTKHQALPAPIVTPATKAPAGSHDESVSAETLIARGQMSRADFDVVSKLALALFARGSAIARSRGLLLVDTKYEFGRRPDGAIVVIDEVHTPDSSRFWDASSYAARLANGQDPESLDKDYIRRYFLNLGYKGDGPAPTMTDEVRIEAARRYIAAFERITATSFVPNLEEPLARIERALSVGES
jgi:phosphoribosylaminoimidazole-succinocarboxamide synthase